MKAPLPHLLKLELFALGFAVCILTACTGGGGSGIAPPAGTGAPNRVTILAAPQGAPQYEVIELPGLGGTFALAGSVNESGLVAGVATLPGDAVAHAVVWHGNQITDLGTLGGPNSNELALNNHGVVAGSAETPDIAPFGESYCQDGAFNVCVPTTWRNGQATALPTLGGANGSLLFGINDRGLAAGVSETAIPDATCPAPQKYVSVPAVWGPKPSDVRQMPMFPGDTNGQAQSVNENGTAVGESGTCSNVWPSATWGSHALLWRDGATINLGNLGGTTGIAPFNINNRDQVVGQSDLPGDASFHGFLWQNGAMTDVGALPGDVSSKAWWINNAGQITGVSIDASHFPRAILLQGGAMYDLNALAPSGSNLLLLVGFAINSSGEIVGDAIDVNTGNLVAYAALRSNGTGTKSVHAFSRTVNVPPAAVANLRRFRGMSRL